MVWDEDQRHWVEAKLQEEEFRDEIPISLIFKPRYQYPTRDGDWSQGARWFSWRFSLQLRGKSRLFQCLSHVSSQHFVLEMICVSRYQRYRWYRHSLDIEPGTDLEYWEQHYPAYLR